MKANDIARVRVYNIRAGGRERGGEKRDIDIKR